jgi:hypothetical protein
MDRLSSLIAHQWYSSPIDFTHVAHGFAGQFSRLLATIGNDVFDQRQVIQIHLRPLTHRRLFTQDTVDHRLLAFDTANAGGTTALLHPFLAGIVGINLMQLPDRALGRLARIMCDARGPDRSACCVTFLATDSSDSRSGDRVVVRLGHLLTVQPRHLGRLGEQQPGSTRIILPVPSRNPNSRSRSTAERC